MASPQTKMTLLLVGLFMFGWILQAEGTAQDCIDHPANCLALGSVCSDYASNNCANCDSFWLLTCPVSCNCATSGNTGCPASGACSDTSPYQ